MKKYLNYCFVKINKILTIGSRPLSGRNFLGTICVHHKSGGNKNKYIYIDFYRRINNYGYIIKIIKNIKFNALICAILYENGLISYNLLTEGLTIGNKIYTGSYFCINTNQIGLTLSLKFIRLFTIINNLEIFPFSKGIIIRAAGCSGLIVKKELNKVVIKLKSNWNLIISKYCLACIGSISNSKYKFNKWIKAGVSRHLGIRPTVRGVAMNPHDHPHGGGEGKKSPPAGQLSPWAWLTKGTPSLKKKMTKKKKKNYIKIYKMNKSSWKLPFIPNLFFRKKFINQKKILNIRHKNTIIPNKFLKKNIKICVFNGIWFLSILTHINMLGKKFGEFIFTKRIDSQTHLKKKVQKKPKGRK